MAYWLVKTDPAMYSWDDLVKAEKTTWDGVRNIQAQNFLQRMQVGDIALVYHSSTKARAVVGVARVTLGPHPEENEKRWSAVTLEAWKSFEIPVTLEAIRLRKSLTNIPLLRQPRLSVMPLTAGQAKAILRIGRERHL